ncbi:uncharacterized protein LOC125060207 [Pieris napi]|uniref:uncharacterized protein LOC125060207 n=1 Tax=Pieris napi TaxID=78633 RepID=UPI001FBB7067|nr:uncharacterized protein LOC125060207 [Pieris napi]
MSVSSLLPEDKRKDQRISLESVYSSNSRLNLLQKRKRMNPAQPQHRPHGEQRVLSAKMHRLKALQNQLADAHFHLQELSNENKILRTMQKKQEVALQRYDSSSAELPQVLSAHSEEMRVQHAKYQQARRRLRDLEGQLRDRDLRLQTLQDQHNHLLNLTRDKNLPEREKLQAQVSELRETARQQQETIAGLQRRLALEAKNFRHRLQAEIDKHRDTRNDLDLAINNADKLSTIIEMKEKMISTAAGRGGGRNSPPKIASVAQLARPLSKNRKHGEDCSGERYVPSRQGGDFRAPSGLSDEDPVSRPRVLSAANVDLAKAVQEGMAGVGIREQRVAGTENSQSKMEVMKTDLMNRIRNNEEPPSRKTSALRRQSTEESVDEYVVEEAGRLEVRVRRSSGVSFYEAGRGESETDTERGTGDGTQTGRRAERYCKDILEDIEKSSRVIDVHVRQLSAAAGAGERLASQLRAVDRVNELVNARGDLPAGAISQLQNEFEALSQHALPSRLRPAADLLGDRALSNRDLLDDLLGKK